MNEYNFLNDLEKAAVEAFNNNEVTREAVRKVILHGVHTQGVLKSGVKHDPKHNWALAYATRDELSNEQIGADLRATAQGIVFVERAFNDLSKIKKAEEPKVKKNVAR